MRFPNRSKAGQLLAQQLSHWELSQPIVLALPRGGVPVAAEIARVLKAPLDVLIVRKIAAPARPELAIGALAEDGTLWWNEDLRSFINAYRDVLDGVRAEEAEKIEMQRNAFRHGREIGSLKGKTAILVDDGLATGATARAAIQATKNLGAERIVFAVPVAASDAAEEIRSGGAEVLALVETGHLYAVGIWYEDFDQVLDSEVLQLLHEAQEDKKVRPLRGLSSGIVRAIAENLRPLRNDQDLDPLLRHVHDRKVVMLGEATHGSSEFYGWRDRISRRLLLEQDFDFVAVEGDWPDTQRLNRYIHSGSGGSARNAMQAFHRWPTWLWANEETAEFIEGLREIRAKGFYGLDVYSLFESIDAVISFLGKTDPLLAKAVRERYSCFDPYRRDEISYARAVLSPQGGCTRDVTEVLQTLLKLRLETDEEEGLFDAQQNARIVVNAENYYRAMLRGDDVSWNVRDSHMMDTLDLLLERFGEDWKEGKGIVWAHNTHIGDYRATDMQAAGYVNLGGLARESYGEGEVGLVGFGTYEGDVVASHAWAGPEEILKIPPAREGSYDFFFHQALELRGMRSGYILITPEMREGVLAQVHGQRAIGVVYDPAHEKRSNYVPTSLARRYDAFVFIDKTSALKSLRQIARYGDIPESWPQGM